MDDGAIEPAADAAAFQLDLQVAPAVGLQEGIFGANTASEMRKTLVIREIYVTVRTEVSAVTRY